MQRRLQAQLQLLLPVAASAAPLARELEQAQLLQLMQLLEEVQLQLLEEAQLLQLLEEVQLLQLLEEAQGSAGGRAGGGIWAAPLLERSCPRRWTADAGDIARCRCRTSLQNMAVLLLLLNDGVKHVTCHLEQRRWAGAQILRVGDEA